jgi:hypothetical protein
MQDHHYAAAASACGFLGSEKAMNFSLDHSGDAKRRGLRAGMPGGLRTSATPGCEGQVSLRS